MLVQYVATAKGRQLQTPFVAGVDMFGSNGQLILWFNHCNVVSSQNPPMFT